MALWFLWLKFFELKFFQENMDFFLDDKLWIFFFWYNFFYFSITTLSEWVSEWVKLLSCVWLGNPMDCRSLPCSSVHEIFQARYWSGLPFPSSEDLPNPGIKPGSPTLRSIHYIIQSVQLNSFSYIHSSLVASTVKNLPAMRENWAWSLGWEDPLEEGMATHSSILAWRSTMDQGAWKATVHGFAKSRIWLSNSATTTVHPSQQSIFHFKHPLKSPVHFNYHFQSPHSP